MSDCLNGLNESLVRFFSFSSVNTPFLLQRWIRVAADFLLPSGSHVENSGGLRTRQTSSRPVDASKGIVSASLRILCSTPRN